MQSRLFAAPARRALVVAMAALLALGALAVPAGAADPTPSDNDTNRANGWAHFNAEPRVGEVAIELVSTKGWVSCFEYRVDGAPTTDPRPNFNPEITDGLWPYRCVSNTTAELALPASSHVEVRMVFGGEADERFSWTRVDVLPDPTPSDNDTNRANGRAHFNVAEVGRGTVELELVQPMSWIACFEYRVDGAPTTDPRPNFNTEITDGLWPYRCLSNNSTSTLELEAVRYVEVRMVFGAERDERFDWTRVDVLPTAQVLLDDLIAAGGITEALAGKVQHALNTAAEWLQIEGKTGPALSHYDRAIHLILWQIDVINKGKDQGDPEGLAELAQAIQELADLYR